MNCEGPRSNVNRQARRFVSALFDLPDSQPYKGQLDFERQYSSNRDRPPSNDSRLPLHPFVPPPLPSLPASVSATPTQLIPQDDGG